MLISMISIGKGDQNIDGPQHIWVSSWVVWQATVVCWYAGSLIGYTCLLLT